MVDSSTATCKLGRTLFALQPFLIAPVLDRAFLFFFSFVSTNSNWGGDQSFDGSIANFRLYNRVLSQIEVQGLHCYNSSRTLDCVGLVAYFDFENALLDRSGSGWSGHLIRGSQTESFFTEPGTSLDGSRALKLVGNDGKVRLPPRTLGGSMSVCADVMFTQFTAWGRIIDFGSGSPVNNLLIGQQADTKNLVV